MQVWKWTITPAGTINAPKGVKWLDVQLQHGETCIWGLVDPAAEIVEHKLVVVGTGHNMPRGEYDYIGTFQMHGGSLVFHAFSVTE